MATALFVSIDDIKRNTIIDGNVDTDKIIQFVKISQQIHVRDKLGSKLYDKISNDIINGTLTGDYLELTNEYIKPMLIHFAMVDYFPFAAYQLQKGGFTKHISENSEGLSTREIDRLIEKEQNFATYYAERLIDFICKDTSKFPEYNQNESGDIYPSRENNYQSWNL